MKIHFFFFLILYFLFIGCKKNVNQNPVPNIAFDITINIDLPSYSSLIGVGGWTYVVGGSKGIIVYRKNVDQFVAFDRQSPNDINNSCATPLTPDTTNFLQLIDYCSAAKFSLYDGSAISGSEFGLRQYQTVWNGTNSLRIYN
jgi:hypothetical protein